jgi:hypothetical protein
MVGEWLEVPGEALPARRALPAQEGLLGDGAERHHCVYVCVVEQRVDAPAVTIDLCAAALGMLRRSSEEQ